MDAHTDGAQASELFPGVVFNILTKELVTSKRRVKLTSRECNLLEFFLEKPKSVRTMDEIARHCFESDSNKKAVYNLVYDLRNTLCIASPVVPRKLSVRLVRGKGYRLSVH